MKSIILFIPIIIFLTKSGYGKIDNTCKNWFNKNGLKPGSSNCELQCLMSKVGMGTFHCPSQCKELCKAPVTESSSMLGKYLYYPGLTKAERNLVKKSPKKAIIAFVQKERAEWSAFRNFPDGKFNDESDAFRHFIWAGLLTFHLGVEKTKLFLDAHEKDPDQPEAEKAMDMANNRGGILAAERLIKLKKNSLKELEKQALKELKEGNLSVLKPGQQIPKEPK